MKKIVFAVLIVVVMLMIGCGAFHEHDWVEATCLTPRVCSECGETDGEAVGHSWNDATCTEAKTCEVCGETEGQPLGHVWAEATCDKPKTCKVCGETEGQPLGHDWKDATCTEAKVCVVCGKVEGDALGHEADTTCTEGAECLRCGEFVESPGHIWIDATCTEPKKCSVCGIVEGEALGHTVSYGICERCNVEVFEPLAGKGDDVLTGINLGSSSLYKAHIKNSGTRNFVVKVYYPNGHYDLLVNHIGTYDAVDLIWGDGPYDFEVHSNGSWSIEFEKIPKSENSSFSGRGDYVTDMFYSTASVWEMTHDGKHNFAVKAFTTSGKDLLVNEIGSYSGKVRFTIPSDSNAFFEVNADGNWTITPIE